MTLRQYTSKYDGDEEDVPHTDAEILLSIVHKDFNPKSLPPPTKEPSAKGTLSTVKVVSSCESSSKVCMKLKLARQIYDASAIV